METCQEPREDYFMSPGQHLSDRLCDACGSSRPADIQRTLKISYQTVKNYLNGRLPSAEMLILISERTGCSIDWLLTGRGKKILQGSASTSAPPAARQIEESVRRICVEVINELNAANHPAQPKTVRLQSSELLSEKVPDEPVTLPGRQR